MIGNVVDGFLVGHRPANPFVWWSVAIAKIMSRLLPHATVHLHPGGHVDLITTATELAPVIEMLGRSDPDE